MSYFIDGYYPENYFPDGYFVESSSSVITGLISVTMATTPDSPAEGSTTKTIGEFLDETGAGVIPKTALWDLRDRYGNILNNRDSVPIPLSSNYIIVLTCSDLLITVKDQEDIYLTVYGTYDSSIGTDLCFRKQAKIIIDNVIGIGI
ncbi:MAG: hypothetical protein GY804_04565 [Alphaproteobacteria bacterium]|nr:hypothetical protein [Alphaproteobacteria bacterium]